MVLPWNFDQKLSVKEGKRNKIRQGSLCIKVPFYLFKVGNGTLRS